MPQSMQDALKVAVATETPVTQATETVVETTTEVVNTPETVAQTPETVVTTEAATTEQKTTEVVAEATTTEVAAAATETTTEDPLWFDNPVTASGEPAKQPEVDYKAKYMEMETILQRPEVAAIVEAVKNNVPLDEVLDKIKRVDYTKLDNNGLISQYGKMRGRTDEQIESDIEMFASLTVSAQDREMEFMQQKLESAQNERLKGLTVVDPKQVEKQNAVNAKLVADVTQRSAAVGKEILGYTITANDIEEYRQFVFGGVVPMLEDGSYDEAKLFKQWFGANRLSNAVSNVAKSAKAEGVAAGKKEALKDVHQPSDNGVVATRLPQEAPKLSDAEKAAKGFAQHMGGNLRK